MPTPKILANHADLDSLGISDETDVLGKTDLEILDPNIAARLYADDLSVLREGRTIRDQEEEFVSDDGKHWTLTSKVPLRDPDGRIVGIVGVSHDITEHKLAEQEIERSRRLLRTVIDLLPSSIYVKDTNARKTLANRADLDFIGLDESQTLGKTDLEIWPNDSGRSTYADDVAVLHEGRSIADREELVTLPNGEQRWGLTTKVPLRDPEGSIIGLVGISHNITERKLAEQALRQVNADLERSQMIANLGSWHWDLANDRLEWSDQLLHVFGAHPGRP